MKLRSIIAVALGAVFMQAHAAPAVAATTAATSPAAQATATAAAAATTPITIPKITIDKEKVSYGIGMDLGENFKAQGIEIDPNMVARGLKDALSGSKPLYTPQDMASTLVAFQKQLMAKRQAELSALAAKNLQASNNFLQANKTKPGVSTTASGLQYKVITPGKDGATATDKDTVTVDYVGTLPNGQVFDSSYKRGKPVTFPVTEVIPGWTEILKLMKPDATYEIYVPANLAYGERGLPPVIGPNQALVFKIHLISMGSKATAA